MKRKRSLIALWLAASSMLTLASAHAAPLSLLSTTPLPAVTGGDFDHFAVDLKRSRLYVAAEKYGSIEVFHLPDGRHIASERSVAKSPHKIELTDNGRQLLIADAGSADAVFVDTTHFNVKSRIALKPQPDSGIADPTTGIFYLGNGGAQSHEPTSFISMISMSSGKLLGSIEVPAEQVKAMAIDQATRRLFVNFRDKHEVGVIDLTSNKLVARWPLPGPSRNSAMTFDPQTKRLFVGSRAPGKLFVLDAADGRIEQTLDITDVSDEMEIDQARKRLYVAGEGGLDVISQNADGQYRIEQHIDTEGGKTFAFVPSLDRLYLVHTKGPAPQAALEVFQIH